MKKNNIIVVVSSHLSNEENNKFINHVYNTIGKVKHNVVLYKNFNQFSLSQIYNKAIKEYNNHSAIMVFCHNDIIFRTQNWGKILLTKFNSFNYQIIGVAGSTYMPASGMWWEDRSKMVGIVEHTDGFNSWVSQYSAEKRGKITPTVMIDGLFIAADVNDVEHYFDEDFKGFHFYDLGFTIPNYLDGINIGVTTDIRILHESVGETNEKWEENRKLFVEKYKEELPININE